MLPLHQRAMCLLYALQCSCQLLFVKHFSVKLVINVTTPISFDKNANFASWVIVVELYVGNFTIKFLSNKCPLLQKFIAMVIIKHLSVVSNVVIDTHCKFTLYSTLKRLRVQCTSIEQHVLHYLLSRYIQAFWSAMHMHSTLLLPVVSIFHHSIFYNVDRSKALDIY